MPQLSLPEGFYVEDRAFDETQEIRAMILAALPYPPLPVTLPRLEEGNRLGDGVLQNTHDIISKLLAHSCKAYSVSDNKERQARQQEILREFLQAIVKDGVQSPPALFRTYCEFSQRHIGTYLKGTAATFFPEVRFQTLDSVCKGDTTHLRMCDYMAAQSRLFELTAGISAQDWMCREYADMIAIARDRLVSEQ